MLIKQIRRVLLSIIFILGSGEYSASQQVIRIKGTVTDAATKETLSYVTVSLTPASLGVGIMTDDEGNYVIDIKAKSEGVQFTLVGYESVIFNLAAAKNGILDVALKSSANELERVVVSAKRTRYTNRNNPAVELIRKAIANKDKNRIEAQETYEYHKYEKLLLSLNELNDSVKTGVLFRNFPFLTNYIDTAKQSGTLMLPIFLRENISEHYFRKSPGADKEFLVASQMANFHDLIEQETIGVFMDGLVGKSNIYDNRIMVLENEYMSPMSPLAPNFYQFHIIDTLVVSGASCINMSIYPRNAQDFGFRGNIYITNDSVYALKRAELAFTLNTNVNFVNNFSMVQEYSQIDSIWCLTLDEVSIDFSITKSKSMMLGQRTNIYSGYRFNHRISDNTFLGINKVNKLPGHDMRGKEFWEDQRPVMLSTKEQGVYDMIDEMKSDKWFNRALDVFGILFSSYIKVGKFDIGPMSTLYSFNDVEGNRIRIGTKTNARFNKHLFFQVYGAYGTKDERFKYLLRSMYSFNEKKQHPWEYPLNLITVSYENNIETPGQFFLFGSADRLFLSVHRGRSQQMIYHQTVNIKYDKEFLSGFSFQPSITRKEEQPTGELIYANENGVLHGITTTQLGLKLRFAPNERFYQIQGNRFPLNHTNPVFSMNYNYGMTGITDNNYTFHRLEVGIDKRTWFSGFGFADMWLKAGKIWGTAPVPLLVIHQANQNYAYQDEAFNMMNYMEFVSDRYALANVSYCFNGWIFNRIPLIKKLKWREFVTFKALWGDVDSRNLPENNPGLLRFPVNQDNIPTMYALGGKPYIETSVAVDNVFKFLRLDLVRRINYLDHPDIPEWGVRFRLRFVF
jgi:hypothetical protein